MHGRYPLPPEGALSECPSRSQKEIRRVPRHLEGWRAGNQKRARPCRLGAKGSAQTRLRLALLSLRPRTAPHGSCWPKWPVAYALQCCIVCSLGHSGIRATSGHVGPLGHSGTVATWSRSWWAGSSRAAEQGHWARLPGGAALRGRAGRAEPRARRDLLVPGICRWWSWVWA